MLSSLLVLRNWQWHSHIPLDLLTFTLVFPVVVEVWTKRLADRWIWWKKRHGSVDLHTPIHPLPGRTWKCYLSNILSGFPPTFTMNLETKQFQISRISWTHQQWPHKFFPTLIIWQFPDHSPIMKDNKHWFLHSNISARPRPIRLKLQDMFILRWINTSYSNEKNSKFWFIWPLISWFHFSFFLELFNILLSFCTIQ